MSKSPLNPNGFEEPVSWRKSKCTPLSAAIKNGNKKWSEKNRVSVALPTANPPHNQNTISSPTKGTAEARLVMTVAPQKDICPQGRT